MQSNKQNYFNYIISAVDTCGDGLLFMLNLIQAKIGFYFKM